jgi:CIC family chloride channel protein
VVGKFILSSIIIGIITGIFITVYSLLTKFLSFLLYFGDPIENISKLPVWYIYLVPLVSILIVNYLISKDEAVKEYGVREIAEAVEQNRLFFGIKDLFLKIFASSLSIASGFAIGNEGPSAAIGAMIAQKIHNFLKLPQKLIKISLSIGASSGIAAIFVSPVTGIMFAIENIAYEFVKSYASYLILASVISFSIAWHFLEPLIFNYSTGKFIEYRYVFATILFIPVMTFFVYLYLGLKDRVLNFLNIFLFEKFSKYKNYIFGIIGSLIISTIMLISPYAVFSGHEVVKLLINNASHLPLYLIMLIIILRIIATSVSLYANAVGGVFIALMSIGALVGYGFGEVMRMYFPVEPFYFAAIGAAVFVGVNMKLPLTAVVLALEITYDYNVIIPTGISVAIVTYLASLNFSLKKFTLRPRIEG